jgi:hypothetical protein
MRETIQRSRQHRDASEDIWANSYSRDLYFGGTLFEDVVRERSARRRRFAKPWAISGPPL